MRGGDRAPGEGDARREIVAIGARQRGVPARRTVKPERNVEIHQPAVLLADRRPVFPAHARIDGEAWIDAPVVVDEGLGDAAAQIFVGIAKGDELVSGMPRRKPAKSCPPRPPVNVKVPRGVLLREHVELLAAETDAGLDIVVAVATNRSAETPDV